MTEPVTLTDGRTVLDAVNANDRMPVAEAVYEQLRALKIEYDLDGYPSGSPHRQRIRTPAEMAARRRGTCLDLALLYAGAAIEARLHPIVIVFEDHALTAIVNRAKPPVVEPDTDAETLQRWIDREILIPIECTGMALGAELDDDFATATSKGRDQLPHRVLRFAIDPIRLHGSGFEPDVADRLDPRRSAILAAGAFLALAAGLVGFRWLTAPEPVAPSFASADDGLAFAPIEGDDSGEIADWLAGPLLDAASPGQTTLVELCRSEGLEPNAIEVWDASTTAQIDLDDPANPAGIDLLVEAVIVEAGPDPGSIDDARIALSFVPFSTELRRAGDRTLLAELPRTAAPVDSQRASTSRFPELRALPAILAGLREIDDGTPAELRAGDLRLRRSRGAFAEQR